MGDLAYPYNPDPNACGYNPDTPEFPIVFMGGWETHGPPEFGDY